jgi:hypothetical protein
MHARRRLRVWYANSQAAEAHAVLGELLCKQSNPDFKFTCIQVRCFSQY